MIELARIVTSYRSLTGAGDVSMVRKDFNQFIWDISSTGFQSNNLFD